MSSRAAEKLTVYDVIGAATDEGEWVNGEFLAVVRNAKSRQGNKPSKADLCDPDSPNIKVAAAWFGGDLDDFEGATVLFGGKGMKVKSYKGKAELNIGKDALVNLVTPAPKGGTPPPESGRASDGGGIAPRGAQSPKGEDQPKVDPTTFFHREMQKQSLGYIHCLQYAQDVRDKWEMEMTDDQFQACASSLYIEGNKRGLFTRVPKLREVDDKGMPFKYLPPAVDPAVEEEKRKAREEADRKAKEAEEARQRAAHQHPQENLDEDVPF